jgi:hypothetical protein
MGQHYIPQYYLSGFSDPLKPSNIWVYEKGCNQINMIPIKVVASENKRWPPETESYLANNVENPATPVIKKIRNRELITINEKHTLACYMIIMAKRVPRGLERMKSLAPKVIEDMFNKLQGDILQLIKEYPSKRDALEAKLNELPSLKLQYETEFPVDIWYQNLKPDMSPQLLTILPQMTWIFLTSDRGQPFLTNDNPFFFDEGLGIGKPESEITFPISSDLTLWANWNKNLKEGYGHAQESIIREINRRTASNATRYVYYSQNAEWVTSLINKRKWRLNRIE